MTGRELIPASPRYIETISLSMEYRVHPSYYGSDFDHPFIPISLFAADEHTHLNLQHVRADTVIDFLQFAFDLCHVLINGALLLAKLQDPADKLLRLLVYVQLIDDSLLFLRS